MSVQALPYSRGSFHETRTKKAWFEVGKDIPEDVLHTSSSMKFQVELCLNFSLN